MGGKESKHFPITYDEALKRVSESEKRRLQDAFRRSSAANSNISKQVRVRDPGSSEKTNPLLSGRSSSRTFWASGSRWVCRSRSSVWWEEVGPSPSENS